MNEESISSARAEHSTRRQTLDELESPNSPHPQETHDFPNIQEFNVVDRTHYRTVLRQVHFHLGCLQLQQLSLCAIPHLQQSRVCYLLDAEQQSLGLFRVVWESPGQEELYDVSVGQNLHFR